MAGKTTRSKSPAVTLSADMRFVVLHGPEPMIKKLRLNQLREALAHKYGDLEPIILDGKAAQLADVFDEVREYALLQPYKLVVVDDAEEFVKTHRPALERYAADPVDHATFVLRADTWHTGILDKLIAKVGAVVRCDAPTEAEAQAWAVGRCRKEHRRALEPAAAAVLVQRLGPHLMQLDTELAKLALMVAADQPITKDLVDRTVQRGSEEQAWAVQEAVLAALAENAPGSSGSTPGSTPGSSGGTSGGGGAIEKIHELVDLSGQADVLVGYFVADLMRKLVVARAMLDAGAPPEEVARAAKVWGPRQRAFFTVLRRHEPARLRQLLADALEADARAKSGLGRPVRNLERFCTTLVD